MATRQINLLPTFNDAFISIVTFSYVISRITNILIWADVILIGDFVSIDATGPLLFTQAGAVKCTTPRSVL